MWAVDDKSPRCGVISITSTPSEEAEGLFRQRFVKYVDDVLLPCNTFRIVCVGNWESHIQM